MPPSIDAPWHSDAAKQARVLQIIVAALVMGCLIFLLTTISIGQIGKPPAWPVPVMAYTVCGLLALEAVAWMVIMRVIAAKARSEIVKGTYKPLGSQQQTVAAPSQDTTERNARYLLPVYQMKTIASAAMFEGLGFFATIAYLIERNPISLGVAVAMILGVAAHFSTQGRVIAWVQRQLEAVDGERLTQTMTRNQV
jgi:hypothetical protein